MLDRYLREVQGFIRDRAQRYMEPDDLRMYINRARREIAGRTQSIRILSPISGSIVSVTILTPGTGYTNPQVVFSTPDTPRGFGDFPAGAQATAIASQIGGQLSNIAVTFGGDGYFQPSVAITDPHGTGATAIANVSPLSVTEFGREVYRFQDIPIQAINPGVGDIIAVKSISFIYANFRYSLPCYDFSTYQASVRQYPQQYLYIPTIAAQFGQGANGSFYFYPIPSAAYQYEIDCLCHPVDLEDDQTYEAIPQPWQDAVPYFAAHLTYLELQNFNAAKFYLDLYDNMVHRYSTHARPGRRTNPYGRW
jgi:hypothetical protein